jgi:hypothetical protein
MTDDEIDKKLKGMIIIDNLGLERGIYKWSKEKIKELFGDCVTFVSIKHEYNLADFLLVHQQTKH